jgi:hypothetical protein
MNDMTQAAGGVLSHVEVMHRPGERDLAMAMFGALGCECWDTGTPSPSGGNYIAVQPTAGQRGLDNVLYLSQVPAEQFRLDELLRARMESDPDLAAAREAYRALAGVKPFGLSHIALRYRDFASLERVLDGLEGRLTPEMRARSTLRIFRPGDSGEITWNSVQAFLHTDIATAGLSLLGQVFELSAYGDWT